MSTTTKRASTKGIRYSDAQKQEIVDFALKYNADNGRGGQSKASEKFNVSPLTVATWMKSGSGASGKAAKASKANGTKPAKASKSAGKTGTRSRYSDEQKKELTDFVATFNSQNGRGGASVATKKFGVSPLTVSAWLKAAGVSSKGKKIIHSQAPQGSQAPKAAATKEASTAPVSGGMSAKLNTLLRLSEEIADAEVELAKLQEKFASLKGSL